MVNEIAETIDDDNEHASIYLKDIQEFLQTKKLLQIKNQKDT